MGVFNQIKMIWHKRSSSAYIKYLRKKGIHIGEHCIIRAPRTARIDVSRPSLVTIGNNVDVINKKAFIKCKKLKKVVIGKNITTIKKQAFFNLPNLKTVVIKSTKLKRVETKAFFKKSGNITFKLPKKYRKKYIKILKKSKLPKKVSFK